MRQDVVPRTVVPRTSLAAGFGLVEIMVSLLIGMLGMLVMYQVFAQAEGQRRTTLSGGDAQNNAVAALLALEREVRAAGHGFSAFPGAGGQHPVLGCTLQRYYAPATPATRPLVLAPVHIADGGPGAPDRITLMAGASRTLSTPVAFAPLPAASGFRLSRAADSLGFDAGDLLLAFEPGQPCTLWQLTGVEGVEREMLMHVPGSSAPFNDPASNALYAAPNAQLLNLGNLEQVRLHQYGVEEMAGQVLTVRDLLREATADEEPAEAVAEGIVNLQAQYGIEAGSGLEWVEPVGDWDEAALTPEQLRQIRAVRIGVVARSAQPERAQDENGTCTTTTAAPSAWPGGPIADLAVLGDWRCYRYRVLNTIIPLRNVLWGEA